MLIMSYATYHPAEALCPGDLWHDNDGFWQVLDHMGGRTYRLRHDQTGTVVSVSVPSLLLPTDAPGATIQALIEAGREGRAMGTSDAAYYALKAANALSFGPEDTHAIIAECQRWIDEHALPHDHPDAVGWIGGVEIGVEDFETFLHELKSRLFTSAFDHCGDLSGLIWPESLDTAVAQPPTSYALRPWSEPFAPSEQRSN